MDTKEIILTPEGKAKLEEELAWREGAKAAEIVESLEEARGFGDLSENAEYDAARDEQARNAARVNEIRRILASAKVVEDSGNRGALASIGSIVEVEDDRGARQTFTIVGTTETNSLEHKISNESPLGAALMGHKDGETVEFALPNGKTRRFKIIKVSR